MELWKLAEQTLGKHLVLKAYLDEWLPKVGMWNGRILFIDGFCGPGEYADGEDGSPIIALKAFRDHPIRPKLKEVGFRFCDEKRATLEHLEERIEELGPWPDNATLSLWHGRFEERMSAILDALDEEKNQLAPALVMLDPFGVKGIPLSLIRRIFTYPVCEVLVSLMWEPINRRISTPEFAPHLDAIYDGPDWRPAIDLEFEERRNFLFDLYEHRMKEAGAAHVVRYDLYNSGKHKYSVFFGTQKWVGADVFKRAVWKFAPDGTFHVRAHQVGMDDFNPVELEEMIRARFGNSWAHVTNELKPFVGSDATPFHTGQLINKTLRPARKAGRLELDTTHGSGFSKNKVRLIPQD